jgi:hypothetical protein
VGPNTIDAVAADGTHRSKLSKSWDVNVCPRTEPRYRACAGVLLHPCKRA